MPIYEFHCTACASTFEQLVKIGQKTHSCIFCSSTEVTKLISQTNFQLRGSGWARDSYETSPKQSTTQAETK
ncbi:MAG: zinc ribbon domain-containing protein [Pseudomonadota bacterium]|nr:zinc ribbon domain-containing protein [Pseudomonadota bacterium]